VYYLMVSTTAVFFFISVFLNGMNLVAATAGFFIFSVYIK